MTITILWQRLIFYFGILTFLFFYSSDTCLIFLSKKEHHLRRHHNSLAITALILGLFHVDLAI